MLAEASGDLISAVQSSEDPNVSVVSSVHGQEVNSCAVRMTGRNFRLLQPNERDMRQLDKMLDDDEEEQEEIEYEVVDDDVNELAPHGSIESLRERRESQGVYIFLCKSIIAHRLRLIRIRRE